MYNLLFRTILKESLSIGCFSVSSVFSFMISSHSVRIKVNAEIWFEQMTIYVGLMSSYKPPHTLCAVNVQHEMTVQPDAKPAHVCSESLAACFSWLVIQWYSHMGG